MISNELTHNKAFPSDRIQGKLTLGTKKMQKHNLQV